MDIAIKINILLVLNPKRFVILNKIDIIIKEINGKRETDYIKVIAAQRKEVYELYRDYIEKLKAALAEDEEARRQ